MDDPLERFAGVYDQYYRNVLRYLLQHAEQGTAEDVASETFLIAWRRFPAIPDPPLPWLLGVARNLLRKQARAGLRRRELIARLARLCSAGDGSALDAGDFVVERAAALDALTSLASRDVEALTLVTWHGLDPAQAAEVVGCSTRAFTVRLSRARQRLARAIESAGQTPGSGPRSPFRPPNPQKKTRFFGATYAETEESWTGQKQARTIVDENLVFSFASAADRARWVAAGQPPLESAAGFGTRGPVTSNYPMTMHWGVGSYQLSLAGIRKLPATAKGLSATLETMWAHEPDRAGAVGFPDPTYAQYIAAWADALLTGPSRPGTRAAIYRLLAEQPGLSVAPGITDPLGRGGVAIGDGGGDYLIIQPGTAELLAYTSNPVRADSVLPASDGVEVYQRFGWSNQLGVRP